MVEDFRVDSTDSMEVLLPGIISRGIYLVWESIKPNSRRRVRSVNRLTAHNTITSRSALDGRVKFTRLVCCYFTTS